MRLLAGAATDVGMVREGNEDGFLIDDRLQLFAVADGMGGHQAGEVASATALEALRASVAAGTALESAVTAANSAVFEKASADEALRGMGTTLTTLSIDPDGAELLIGHVGDSRAYLIRDGELRQITEDHSLVEELVREGRLTPEQADVHPQRSIITRALGIDADVNVDLVPVEIRPGDRILLCSDGLTTMLRTSDIATILRREPDPGRAADLLVDAANAAGGEDNITAVIIEVEDDGLAGITGARVAGASAVGAPAPPADVDAPPTRRQRRRRDRGGGRRRTFARVVLWTLPVLIILGIGVGAVGWYARHGYYLKFVDNKVVMFKGVDGGLLGFDPTRVQDTKITRKQLNAAGGGAAIDAIAATKTFGSRSAADAYVRRLRTGIADANRPTTTTTIPTTTTAPTTTAPGTPTTAVPTTPPSGP
ncbi:MAG: serine/threonine protein phosphatase [Actinomycetia bacterium]|nr:serine/threonine protein phosphatase [Actinomycetes bacterium]